VEFGRGFDHLGVSCIECLALVSGWKVENLDDLNGGWLGVFITPTTKLAVWWRLLSGGAPDKSCRLSGVPPARALLLCARWRAFNALQSTVGAK
jgi:hypothetical protein